MLLPLNNNNSVLEWSPLPWSRVESAGCSKCLLGGDQAPGHSVWGRHHELQVTTSSDIIKYVVKHKFAKLFMTYAVGKLEAALNISHQILSTSSQRVS